MAENNAQNKTGIPIVLPVANEDIAFTPVINGISAVYGVNSGLWSRTSNRMKGTVRIVFTSVSAISGIYTLLVPGNLNVDGQFIGTNSESLCGNISIGDSSAGYLSYVGLAYLQSSTRIQFKMHGQTSFNNSTAPVTIAAGDTLDINFDIPILEWRGAGMVANGAGLATSVRAGLVSRELAYSGTPVALSYVSGGVNGSAFNGASAYFQRVSNGYHVYVSGTMTISAASSRTVYPITNTSFSWPAGTPVLTTVYGGATMENASNQMFPVGAKLAVSGSTLSVTFDFVYPAGSSATTLTTFAGSFFIPVVT